MELLFLGTSCAVPTADNGHSSFFVLAGGHIILFEAGNDPVRGMLKTGIDPLKVDIVVLSHHHADHVSGFPAMISTLDCLDRSTPLTVIAPEETIHRMKSVCDILGLDHPHLSFEVRYAGSLIMDELSILLYPAHHTVPSAMVRCTYADTSLFYSGDTTYDPNTGISARGCKALIHEATTSNDRIARLPGHSSAYQAGCAASSAEVDTLFLIHLCYAVFKDPLTAEKEAQLGFMGKVIVPELRKRYVI